LTSQDIPERAGYHNQLMGSVSLAPLIFQSCNVSAVTKSAEDIISLHPTKHHLTKITYSIEVFHVLRKYKKEERTDGVTCFVSDQSVEFGVIGTLSIINQYDGLVAIPGTYRKFRLLFCAFVLLRSEISVPSAQVVLIGFEFSFEATYCYRWSEDWMVGLTFD